MNNRGFSVNLKTLDKLDKFADGKKNTLGRIWRLAQQEQGRWRLTMGSWPGRWRRLAGPWRPLAQALEWPRSTQASGLEALVLCSMQSFDAEDAGARAWRRTAARVGRDMASGDTWMAGT